LPVQNEDEENQAEQEETDQVKEPNANEIVGMDIFSLLSDNSNANEE